MGSLRSRSGCPIGRRFVFSGELLDEVTSTIAPSSLRRWLGPFLLSSRLARYAMPPRLAAEAPRRSSHAGLIGFRCVVKGIGLGPVVGKSCTVVGASNRGRVAGGHSGLRWSASCAPLHALAHVRALSACFAAKFRTTLVADFGTLLGDPPSNLSGCLRYLTACPFPGADLGCAQSCFDRAWGSMLHPVAV